MPFLQTCKECFWDEVNKVKNLFTWAKENMSVVYIVAITAILSYGYQMTNFTMSIDDERNFSRGLEVKAQLCDGRYTAALINAFVPHKTLPFWQDFLFVVLISFAALCLARIVFQFGCNIRISALAAVVFITMPIHAYNSMFSMACIGTPIGYLLCVASVVCVYEWYISRKPHRIICAILYAVLMHGEYQAFISMYIALTCFVILGLVFQKEKDIFMLIFEYIIVFLCSLFIYWIISKLLGMVFPSRGYVESLINWGTKSYTDTVHEIIEQIIKVNFYPVVNRGYNTIPILNIGWIITLVIGIYKVKGLRLEFLLAMIGLWASNNIFFVILGGFAAPRMCLAMPVYAMAVIWLLFNLIDRVIWKNAIIVFSCFIALYQSATIVELGYIDNKRQLRDTIKAEQISTDIEKLGFGTIPDEKIALVNVSTTYDGYWMSDNTFGLSYFALGEGRLESFFEQVGYPYNWCNADELVEAEKFATETAMPSWPQEGSITYNNKIIIINLEKNY